MSRLKTGKQPHVFDADDLMFGKYRTNRAIARPSYFGHEAAVKLLREPWGMLGNGPDDSVRPGFGGAGDCVFAGGDHEVILDNAIQNRKVRFTGSNAIADYSAVTGYRIGDEQTDNGTNVRDALKYRQKTGLIDADGNRHKIGAYVAIEPGHWEHVLDALYIFGHVGIGFLFPDYAMDQFDAGKAWSYHRVPEPNEGHYVPLVGHHSQTYALSVVSWGKVQLMTKAFFMHFCDEAYAWISPEALSSGNSIEGFDMVALNNDLQEVMS